MVFLLLLRFLLAKALAFTNISLGISLPDLLILYHNLFLMNPFLGLSWMVPLRVGLELVVVGLFTFQAPTLSILLQVLEMSRTIQLNLQPLNFFCVYHTIGMPHLHIYGDSKLVMDSLKLGKPPWNIFILSLYSHSSFSL